ncbi:MAG: precorrin-4 C(11)-methyltransferase [Bacteroidaceae bacterium]|nr:precorrin-4 C(11)-methyltransferase [Bacteroidaceae bacterium]
MIRYEYVGQAGRSLAEKIEAKIPPLDNDAIVFVGALGICVRKLQGLINNKHTDPAVVCVDTTGRWVIPVLSGHVGGANDLARRIAAAIGAEAVITTQSDNAGLWALDTLANDYGWCTRLADGVNMNDIIFAFVNRKPTALIIEWDDAGTKQLRSTCPDHVTVFDSYEDYQHAQQSFELTICVGYHSHSDITLYYIPRCLHLGVGCQRLTPEAAADQLLDDVRRLGILTDAIATVGTVELKRDEPMVKRLGRYIGGVSIYTSEKLAEMDVPNASDKVREVTGSPSVAEASALMVGTRLVVEKQKGCFEDSYYTFAIAEQTTSGHIEIVGAGPGDPELISLRGRRLLERADLILYAGSLVPKALTECAKAGATVRSSADLNLEQQFELMREHYEQGHLIVRLHTGDPCIYGAIGEQMALFDQHHMSYHITPGISSFQAAAAELQCQFTIPEQCQTIILTRGEGRTAMPEREKLHMLAEHQSTMCIFLSATLVDEVQRELLAGGYPADTPVAVCHKLTWPEQAIYRGQLGNLSQLVHNNSLTLTTMIVVGRAIGNREGLSRLYSHQFSHLFRSSSI